MGCARSCFGVFHCYGPKCLGHQLPPGLNDISGGLKGSEVVAERRPKSDTPGGATRSESYLDVPGAPVTGPALATCSRRPTKLEIKRTCFLPLRFDRYTVLRKQHQSKSPTLPSWLRPLRFKLLPPRHRPILRGLPWRASFVKSLRG